MVEYGILGCGGVYSIVVVVVDGGECGYYYHSWCIIVLVAHSIMFVPRDVCTIVLEKETYLLCNYGRLFYEIQLIFHALYIIMISYRWRMEKRMS